MLTAVRRGSKSIVCVQRMLSTTGESISGSLQHLDRVDETFYKFETGRQRHGNAPSWRPRESRANKGKMHNEVKNREVAKISTADGHDIYLDTLATQQSAKKFIYDLERAVKYFGLTSSEFPEEDAEIFRRRASKLISACWRNGMSEEAYKVFNSLQVSNIQVGIGVMNAIIPVFTLEKDLTKLVGLFEYLRDNNIELDIISFNSLMKAALECGSLHHAEDFFQKITKWGLKPNTISYNTILQGKIQFGHFEEACQMFKDLLADENFQPSEWTYCTLICALTQRKQYEQALTLLGDMCEKGLPVPNVVSNSLIASYASDGMIQEALEILQRMKETGTEINRITFTSLLKACKVKGSIDQVRNIYNQMLEHKAFPDIIAYCEFINAAARNGCSESVRFFVEEARKRRVSLDMQAYNVLIHAYGTVGLINDAEEMFVEALKLKQTKPEAYNAMMTVYNQQQDAENFYNVCKQFLETSIFSSRPTVRLAMRMFTFDYSGNQSIQSERYEMVMKILDRVKGPLPEDAFPKFLQVVKKKLGLDVFVECQQKLQNAVSRQQH
jgi:pentatricopeptide repeat protein